VGGAWFYIDAQSITTQAQKAGQEVMYLLDTKCWHWKTPRDAYGRLRTGLERQGERIGAHDTLIAANAIALGVTLVTNNKKGFRRIKGLRTENRVACTRGQRQPKPMVTTHLSEG